MQREVGSYSFFHVCSLVPQSDSTGKLHAYLPQVRYLNTSRLEVHKYGSGPFCKFVIPRMHRDAGVYLLTVDDKIEYIGECRNLVKRYNSGYGHISPRNCYVGGRSTNCRINNLIYQAASVGKLVDLWFLQTKDHKAVEKELIAILRPQWNRKS